ncbi:MAG: threonine ammonia-lyase [Bradymonadaceae bacterium]
MASDSMTETAPDAADSDVITFDEIQAAQRRIRDAIYVSPCPESENLSERTGATVHLKMENLQRTGSFKERGASNKLQQLDEDQRERGVIAASAGNHAQAVAYHGTRLDIESTIVMPEGTPLVKVTRTRRFGAEVILEGSNYDEAYAHACQLADERDLEFVHPFNDRAIIAGQGTLGLELLEQNPYIDTVVCAVGGGGLISGMAAALKETNPEIRVVGVEPESLPSMKTALERREIVEVPEGQTIADGIAVRKVGNLTYASASKYVDEMVTVDEQEIANAILVLLEEEKTVAEGAGAASVAALLADKVSDIEGEQVFPIICGGNIDVNVISKIIDRGLAAAGRIFRLDLQIRDVPGSLAKVLTRIGELDANVLEVYHDRTFAESEGSQLGVTNVELKLETRGREHIERIRETLQEDGYEILDHL